MRRPAVRCRAAVAAVVIVAAFAAPARGQDHALTLHGLKDSDLPLVAEPLPHYHSRSAGEAAAAAVPPFAAALAWFNGALGRQDTATLAVLDVADYARFASRPYPMPYAEVVTDLVVLPDDIAAFPGFPLWDIDARTLSDQLSVHELGHLLADEIGIWSRSEWVNELVANVFLAAWLRAAHPGERGLLEGVPPRFGHRPSHMSLARLDLEYAAVDPADYAWFQFKIAALADRLVAATDFPGLVAALRAAFPDGETTARPTPEEALRRLEQIAPGATGETEELSAPLDLPAAATIACAAEETATPEAGLVVLENRGEATIHIDTRAHANFQVRLEWFGSEGLSPEEEAAEIARLTDEALADGRYGWPLPPAHWRVLDGGETGAVFHVAGGGPCLVTGAVPSRFDWDGR